jgi:hypothetical protein
MHATTPYARLAASAIALILVTGGCVSKGKYEAMRRERDVYAAQYATLTAESLAIADVAVVVGEELAIRDQELAKLKQTQAQMELELEALIAAGLIRIKLLRDGLHVVLAEEVLFGSGSAEINEAARRRSTPRGARCSRTWSTS